MMTTPSMHRLAAIIVALLALPASAHAQGAISNQGFGYPTGQLSPAALGTGGANGEVDPSSPLNPAAISHAGRFAVLMQFEPEFRATKIGSVTAANTVVRFPTFMATGGVGRFTFAASFANFLDRTWVNSYDDSVFVGGAWEESSVRTSSDGAISDARLAVAFAASPRIRVGLGVHSFTGENRAEFLRTFPDSSGLGGLAQSSHLTFVGRAISGGVVVLPREGLAFAASFRSGGGLEAALNDVPSGEASVPSRWGVSGSWVALPGATLNARYEQTQWTEMRGLGTGNVFLFDAAEVGLGAEITGPPVAGAASIFRLGFRDRTLPFGVNGDRVSERSFSVGAGLPVARGRGQLDIALQRAFREVGPATERSWFLSVGIGIRP